MTIDSYDSPDAEALLRAGEERPTRQLRRLREHVTNGVGAVGFLLAAALLAGLAPWDRSLSLSNLALVLVAWLVVEQVKFPVAGGWTWPTMLVFVPMLFLLPAPVVPLVALSARLLRRTPDLVRGRAPLAMLPTYIGDTWFAMGPALVLVVAGAQRFAWSNWPVYVAALVAQVLFDIASSISHSWFGERVSPHLQLPLLVWAYVVDVTLAPLGLVIASAAVIRPGLVVLALSPAGLLYLFARERQERLDAILELSTAYRGTTLLLCDMVEADDRYTAIHSRDVVDLSLGVADALGLDSARRRNVEFSALLHDVGKVRVPKEIINKPGRLDASEWEIVRRHTIEGEAMLKQVGGKIASLGAIVRASHERWDGGGYPDGLIGEQIPIEARIVAACDAFSAMTTDRPYRLAMSVQEALDELRRGADSQFDPRVVTALESCIEAELLTAEGQPLADRPDTPGRRVPAIPTPRVSSIPGLY